MRPIKQITGAVILLAACQPLAWAGATPTAECTDDAPCETPGIMIYRPAEFAAASPYTALDLLELLPGFVMEDDSNVRGLGASAGNVLVDGSHPVSKGGGVRDALERIPVANVDHIEIRNAASLPGQTSSYNAVANVVTRNTERTSQWAVSLERARSGDVYPSLELANSSSAGDWNYNIRGGLVLETLPGEGQIVDTDAAGDRVSVFDESRLADVRDTFVTAGAERDYDGSQLKYNLRLDDQKYEPTILRLESPNFESGERIRSQSHTRQGELGVNWNRTLTADWQLRVAGLGTVVDESFASERLQIANGSDVPGSAFQLDSRRDEWVIRATAVNQRHPHWLSRFGTEVAYNRLSSTLRVPGTGDSSEALQTMAHSVVDEFRSELFSVWRYDGIRHLSIEFEGNFEFSKISVSGDASREENLFYAKPGVVLTWANSEVAQTKMSVRRYVSQLSFEDFAASADFVLDRETAGNARLRPENGIRAEIEYRHQWSERTILTTSLFHEWQDDVLEYTIFDNSFEGIANLGSARLWGASLSGSVGISNILRGGIVYVDVTVQNSVYVDSLTATERDVTGLATPVGRLRFRQDVPDTNTAWGITYGLPTTQTQFFAAERQSFKRSSYVNLFVERNLAKRGGEGGIRTLEGLLTLTPLAGERFRPLSHLSGYQLTPSSLLVASQF